MDSSITSSLAAQIFANLRAIKPINGLSVGFDLPRGTACICSGRFRLCEIPALEFEQFVTPEEIDEILSLLNNGSKKRVVSKKALRLLHKAICRREGWPNRTDGQYDDQWVQEETMAGC
jgi:hypothetical protein